MDRLTRGLTEFDRAEVTQQADSLGKPLLEQLHLLEQGRRVNAERRFASRAGGISHRRPDLSPGPVSVP